MASLGHIAAGMAAARFNAQGDRATWGQLAAWSMLSLAPDVDVVGFAMGVHYGDPWGHRGAAHSLLFTAALGIAFGLATARPFQRSRFRNVPLAIAVAVSHPLLDTMTDGGLGCALLWPFDLTRFFAPWRPIPVAPIGLAFFSPYGLMVSLVEIALFAPVILFAFRQGRARAAVVVALAGVWIAACWLIASTDPVRDRALGFVLREDTRFSNSYSEDRFRAIAIGETDASVRRSLGAPYAEDWVFSPSDDGTLAWDRPAPESGCFHVRIESGVVAMAHVPGDCGAQSVRPGTPADDVSARLGSPSDACWEYSWSPSRAHHRQRIVCFARSKVVVISRRWE